MPFLSLFLLLLTIHPIGQFWASWFAFVPLFLFILKNPRPMRDTFLGFALGLVYYSALLYWIFRYNGLIFLKVIPLASLPWGFFFGITSLSMKCFIPPRRVLSNLIIILLPPFVWIFLIALSRYSPLGPLPLETPFYQPLPFLEIASVGGMGLVIFLILAFNTSLALLINTKERSAVIAVITLSISAFGVFGFGFSRLAKSEEGSIRIALIQSNFPISVKWREENQKYILEKYETWAKTAVKMKPAVIFFPQYALPFDAYRQPDFFIRLAKETNAFVVLATYTPRKAGVAPEVGGQYNIALVFSPDKGLAGEYRATQGPPFRQIGQVFGTEFPVIDTPAGRLGILLCYEDAVPSVSKRWIREGVEYLATLSNTGHFVGTNVPHYHLLQDQLRAIETGRDVIRVTPNGYSAVIDSLGRLRAQSHLDREEIVISTIRPLKTRPRSISEFFRR